MRRIAFSVALLLATAAGARQPDGTLGLIQTPNDGVPAVVEPGGVFEAVLEEEAKLSLEGGGAVYPLSVTFSAVPGGKVAGRCVLPPDLPEGSYALCVEADNRSDRNVRAVHVFDPFPEYYVIAHVSDTHLGKDQRHPRPSDAIIGDVFRSVNESDATFVLVTGDLTETGGPEEFQRFLAVLDTCTLPTFVCPGNHDRQALNYEQFFGTLSYRFRFGQDGYLAFDTKDFITADELGPQDGALQRYRREIRDARFSVGFTHRYEPFMGMRSQLALFVDNPLDFLLFGHWHRENSDEEKHLPWGKTRMSVVPAAIDGKLRLLDMTAKGLIPRAVTDAAPVDTAAAPPPNANPAP